MTIKQFDSFVVCLHFLFDIEVEDSSRKLTSLVRSLNVAIVAPDDVSDHVMSDRLLQFMQVYKVTNFFVLHLSVIIVLSLPITDADKRSRN